MKLTIPQNYEPLLNVSQTEKAIKLVKVDIPAILTPLVR
jgi:hypothetical protein